MIVHSDVPTFTEILRFERDLLAPEVYRLVNELLIGSNSEEVSDEEA